MKLDQQFIRGVRTVWPDEVKIRDLAARKVNSLCSGTPDLSLPDRVTSEAEELLADCIDEDPSTYLEAFRNLVHRHLTQQSPADIMTETD